MKSLNRHSVQSNAPRTPSKPSSQVEVLPGDNWVVERTEEDGTRTVLPLIGWQVVDGEVFPLPRSLGPEWIVRPMVESDATSIRTTAMRLRPQPKQHQNDWNQWRINLRP